MKLSYLSYHHVFLSVLITTLLVTTSKVYAGGYDDPNLLTDGEQASKLTTIPSILNWDKWEKPYLSGSNVCRRKNGDLICLPTEIAKKVGVNIDAPKKATTTPIVKRK